MDESLEKAVQALGFAANDLQAALREANPVESIVLLPLIKRTVETLRDVKALQEARASKE